MARTSPHIGNTPLEMMNLILKFVNNFDADRLLYAINGKHLDEDDIESITDDIVEYNSKLCRQKTHLFKFGKTFNKRFTTEKNKFVDSSLKVSRKIRSGTAGVKKIFKMFCKPLRKRLPDGHENPQAHERSMINTPNYVADLFGLESYPQCVMKLFSVMLEFYGNLDDSIEECKRLLQQEKETRHNLKQLVSLLDQAIEKSQREQAHIILSMKSNPEMMQAIKNDKSLSSDDCNPVLKEYKKRKSKEEFAQRYFHNCMPADISKIGLYKSYSNSDDDPEMLRAIMVFGDDKEKIVRINYAIEHFDSLLPAQCKSGKIPAMLLYFFMEWCAPAIGVKSFLDYFNKRYTESKGRWGTIGYSAINGAHSKCTLDRENSIDVKRAEFLKKIEDLVSIFNKEK